MSFSLYQCDVSSRFDKRYVYAIHALLSEAAFSFGSTYFSTQKVLRSFLDEALDSSFFISIAVVNSVLSTGIILSVYAPNIYAREFEQRAAPSGLESVRSAYPCLVFILEKALFLNAFTVMFSCWFVVSNMHASLGVNIVSVFLALGVWRGYYAYVQHEALKHFLVSVHIYQGHEALNRDALRNTVLTSVTGSFALSSFTYFLMFPAFKSLGSVVALDHSTALRVTAKSMALFTLLISFFVTLMSESGSVYHYFNEQERKGRDLVEWTLPRQLLFRLVCVILFVEMIGTLFAYDQALCETASDFWDVESTSWLLRAGMLPLALSGTWNYSAFILKPAYDFFKQECKGTLVHEVSIYNRVLAV